MKINQSYHTLFYKIKKGKWYKIVRLRNIPGAKEAVASSTYVYHTPEEAGKDIRRPLYIEIGMGKGRFIIDNACRYSDISFIGIEKYESVMIRALQKLDRMEAVDRPDNVRFIRMDAEDILDYFPAGFVDRIYLNFSDPWPKDRHARRRLPSKEFLGRFRVILADTGTIEFKTDNKDLFAFAMHEYAPAGFELVYSTEDLHSDTEAMKDNIMTEYEEKFSSIGNPICKYIIRKSLF